jgi:hypothetical protein
MYVMLVRNNISSEADEAQVSFSCKVTELPWLHAFKFVTFEKIMYVLAA